MRSWLTLLVLLLLGVGVVLETGGPEETPSEATAQDDGSGYPPTPHP